MPASAALASPAHRAAISAGHPGTKRAAATSALSAARGTSRNGVLTGIVRGAGDIPLAGACVSAAGPGVTRHAFTNRSGRYAFTSLRPGDYRIRVTDCASPDSYQASTSYRVLVDGGRYTTMHAITLAAATPAAGLATERRYLSSHPGAVKHKQDTTFISGTVRSTAGKPLAGICVTAWVFNKLGGEQVFWSTGLHGRYDIPNVFGILPGKWHVLFTTGCGSVGNYAPQWWDHASSAGKATPLHATATSHFTGINGALGRGGEITGVIRGSSNHGPRLARICAAATGLGGMTNVDVETVTGKNGSYRLTGLGTGTFSVRFSPFCGSEGNYLPRNFGKVHATAGKTHSGVNTFLLLGGQITGTVSSAAGGTIKGVCVEYASLQGASNEAQSGERGGYAFHNLPPGSYEVAFAGGCGNTGSYAPQYYDNQQSPAGASIIDITLGDNQGDVNAVMQPGGTISGEIINQGTGSPLPASCVLVTSQQEANGFGTSLTDVALGYNQAQLALTGPNGGYSFSNLAPGAYLAQATPDCEAPVGDYATEWYSPDGSGSPEWLSVNAGTPETNVDIQLPRGSFITGKITNTAGRGIGDMCVFPIGVGSVTSEIPAFYSAGVSLSGGRYRVSGLAPGQYDVEFEACLGGPYADQWYDGQGSSADANPVTVPANQTVSGIDATLNGGGTVAGTITDQATGEPVRDACVLLVDSGQSIVYAVTTGKKGQYALPFVAAGSYSVQASQCEAATPALAAVVSSVQVKLSQTARANVALPPAGGFTGSVSVAGGAAGAAVGTCVEATPVSGNGQAGVGVVGPAGSYLVTGLASGTYQVLFTPACLYGVPGTAPEQTTSTVTVTAGSDTPGVDATLTQDGAIAGTATSKSTGGSLGGICVAAYAGATAATPAEVGISNADGSYQLQNLVPGSYIVRFFAGCGTVGYLTQWWQAASSAAAATAVPVTAGATTDGIDASLAAS